MGVLVGTSLIVIIPEGIEAIYSASGETMNGRRSLQMQGRGLEVQWAPSAMNAVVRREGHVNRIRGAGDTDAFTIPGPVIPEAIEIKSETTSTPSSSTAATGTEPPSKVSDEETPTKEGKEHHDYDAPTFYIGFSLISGFVLMFLIDKLPRHASENLQPPPPTRHISLDNLSQGLHFSPLSSGDENSESFLQSLTPTPKQSRSLATTTGLVIHAAADGIAMGASASSSDAKLGFVISVAIMIHKAPAAFGLTSVLLKQGLSKRAARGHLIIFSLAAPFGALSTWLLIHILGGGGGIGEEKGQWWTGMLLLFSGGTFL
jgi:zinc transporter 9